MQIFVNTVESLNSPVYYVPTCTLRLCLLKKSQELTDQNELSEYGILTSFMLLNLYSAM